MIPLCLLFIKPTGKVQAVTRGDLGLDEFSGSLTMSSGYQAVNLHWLTGTV